MLSKNDQNIETLTLTFATFLTLTHHRYLMPPHHPPSIIILTFHLLTLIFMTQQFWFDFLPPPFFAFCVFGSLPWFVPFWFFFMLRPEFSYRPGLGPVSEDTTTATTTTTTPLSHGSGGPPNRPLPPTPDDDDQAGDRTLIMKRVSPKLKLNSNYLLFNLKTIYSI